MVFCVTTMIKYSGIQPNNLSLRIMTSPRPRKMSKKVGVYVDSEDYSFISIFKLPIVFIGK